MIKIFSKFLLKTFADSENFHTFAPQSRNKATKRLKTVLVEQRTENPCVPGSIPGGTTFTKRKIMKTAEIQLFQWFFLYVLSAKICNLVQ